MPGEESCRELARREFELALLKYRQELRHHYSLWGTLLRLVGLGRPEPRLRTTFLPELRRELLVICKGNPDSALKAYAFIIDDLEELDFRISVITACPIQIFPNQWEECLSFLMGRPDA